MTDDKVMVWLKDKEKHIKNKSENHMYAYGVTLGVSDLPYINRLKHILSAKKRNENSQACWRWCDGRR